MFKFYPIISQYFFDSHCIFVNNGIPANISRWNIHVPTGINQPQTLGGSNPSKFLNLPPPPFLCSFIPSPPKQSF